MRSKFLFGSLPKSTLARLLAPQNVGAEAIVVEDNEVAEESSKGLDGFALSFSSLLLRIFALFYPSYSILDWLHHMQEYTEFGENYGLMCAPLVFAFRGPNRCCASWTESAAAPGKQACPRSCHRSCHRTALHWLKATDTTKWSYLAGRRVQRLRGKCRPPYNRRKRLKPGRPSINWVRGLY